VQGTPTLFIGDEKVPEDAYQFDGLAAKLDAAIAAAGGAAPPAAPAKPN
jgi:protein-disulfide isomerase